MTGEARPSSKRKLFTIGYGGRSPEELLERLARHGVRAVVDVRLSPRGHLGSFTRASAGGKGIQGLLARRGIEYVWVRELGNPFRDRADWREPYRAHLESLGAAVLDLLAGVPEPYCLLCAEHRPSECHRACVAERLADAGYEIEHL
jgi:uncharacterized protein (DUF488 family)